MMLFSCIMLSFDSFNAWCTSKLRGFTSLYSCFIFIRTSNPKEKSHPSLLVQARSKAKTTEGTEQNCQTKLPLPRPVTPKTDRLGSLRCNENIKKVVDLVSKTITLHLHHTFWYISLPFLLRGLPREIS